jgi:hypothetical protein
MSASLQGTDAAPAGRVVIGPVVTREGGYAFDLWTPESGVARGFRYRLVEDARYARKYEIKSQRPELAGSLTACATLDEFTAALRNRDAWQKVTDR